MKQAYIYNATVTNIVDGDTIDAIVDLGFKMRTTQRLRLLGVDAPELHSADANLRLKAKETKTYLERMLLFSDVVVQTEKSDAFGRYLATVEVEVAGVAINVNDELIRLGLAVAYVR